MEKNLTRAQLLRNVIGFATDYAAKEVDKRVDALTPDRSRPPWVLNETEF